MRLLTTKFSFASGKYFSTLRTASLSTMIDQSIVYLLLRHEEQIYDRSGYLVSMPWRGVGPRVEGLLFLSRFNQNCEV